MNCRRLKVGVHTLTNGGSDGFIFEGFIFDNELLANTYGCIVYKSFCIVLWCAVIKN
jgi:hypothetical protein